MKSILIPALTAAALLAASPLAVQAAQLKGHELASQAKVGLAEARATALKARPGKIVAAELEKEGGGSGLRYSFDIKSHGKTYEVGIDAADGKVLENATETAAQERQETGAERAQAKAAADKK